MTAGKAPRPKLASGPLTVTAQGAILKDDDRLIIVVRVLDDQGVPVTGLKKANFKLWQMAHLFGQSTSFFVVEIADIPGLEGLYHLVQKTWSVVGSGTIPFFVRVEKGKLRSGAALTFIVKVREGLDL
ncbi:MAG TPA: hypothetical protein VLC71_12700 [Thermomonas sp.]|nr:hypothetical protein [Thermomonas sp.]